MREYLGREHFAYLITVCTDGEQECPTFPGVSFRKHWPFDDPAAVEGDRETRLAVFRRVRDEIDRKVQDWIAAPDTQERSLPGT